MAESSFASTENDLDDAVLTSTPLQDSLYSLRRKQRASNYLSGASRGAFSLENTILRSLSTSESSLSTEDCSDEVAAKRIDRVEKCSRGCSAVLGNLAKAFEKAGRHCWPTKMYRQHQVPAPVKGTDQYRNITGGCWPVFG